MKRILSLVCFFITLFNWITPVAAQCNITWLSTGSQSGCQGTYTLSATSLFNETNSNVNAHHWYKSDGTRITPSTEFRPTNGVYVSELTAAFTSSQTFYVAAICNGVESGIRKQVTITISDGSNVNLSMSPAKPPYDLCEGETITLTASGGESFTWQTPQGTRSGSSIIAVLSGKYTVTTINNCGLSRSASIDLTFYPRLGEMNHTPTSVTFCDGDELTPVQFSAFAANAKHYTFSITGTGNTISNEGLATLSSDFIDSATVTIRAWGCSSTASTAVSTIHVASLPDNTTNPSGQIVVPDEINCITIQATQGSGYRYTWYRGPTELTFQREASIEVCEAGTYKAKITNSYGCSATTSPVTVEVPNNYNFLLVNNPLVDATSEGKPLTEQDIYNLPFTQLQQSFQYIDGLGRPIQTVKTQASPSLTDVVNPTKYDEMSREVKKYLPFTIGEDGFYKSRIDSTDDDYLHFYNRPSDSIADDTSPIGETRFEADPIGRVIYQGFPGEAWQIGSNPAASKSNVVQRDYKFNSASEVYLFRFDPVQERITLTDVEYYRPNTLYKNSTIDEQKNEVVEFLDKHGKVVCKKVEYAKTAFEKYFAETYYIYDDFGSLVMVLPPEAVNALRAYLPQP